MLENLLKDLLSLEVREEYREINKGEIREINLNDRCDQAYIRNKFRRYLKANRSTLEGIRMIDNFHNGVRYNFDSLDTLEDLNKVIESINKWVNVYCVSECVKPLRLELF